MGQASARSVSNHTVTGNHGHELSKTWVHAYMSRKQDYLQDHMILADVKLTNTCNFACAMCNPADSSRVYAAWARNPSHAVVQMHLEKTPHYLDQVKEHFVYKNRLVLTTPIRTCSSLFLDCRVPLSVEMYDVICTCNC
jgi:hypothetical protein